MSALVTLGVSLIASLPILAQFAWFGRGDIPRFLAGSVPLGLATIPIARSIASRGWSLPVGLSCAILFGLPLGLAWSFLVIGALWVLGAANIPFTFIWPFAAAAGIAAELGFRSGPRTLVGTGVFVILMTACPFAAVQSWPYIAGWQVLTVVKMKVIRPAGTLEIVNGSYLTSADVQLLRESGVVGVVEVEAASMIGRGPVARALVVSTSPLDRGLVINQPHRATAVYIQSHDRVRIFPTNTPLHRWRLRFESQRDDGFERSINVWAEQAGGWSGGGLIHW